MWMPKKSGPEKGPCTERILGVSPSATLALGWRPKPYPLALFIYWCFAFLRNGARRYAKWHVTYTYTYTNVARQRQPKQQQQRVFLVFCSMHTNRKRDCSSRQRDVANDLPSTMCARSHIRCQIALYHSTNSARQKKKDHSQTIHFNRQIELQLTYPITLFGRAEIVYFHA